MIYNGIPRELHAAKHRYAGDFQLTAEHGFQPSKSVGPLGLFDKSGAELNRNQTLVAQGVKDGDTLLMRPLVMR